MSASQLHLFGEPGPAVAGDSPLASARVKALLRKWPRLYLGTSSWSFSGWKGLVYRREHSAGELARHGLKAYAQIPLFRTVSLDRSYYRPMELSEFSDLAKQVPKEFRFIVKAPRELLQVTAGGIDSENFSRRFLKPMGEGLGERVGLVLLQFPPGSVKDSASPFVPSLKRFLSALPKDFSYSLEVREESLVGPALAEAIQGTTVSLCASIHSSLPSPDQQLLKVPPNPGTPILLRWNLRPSLAYQEAKDLFAPFQQIQSEDLVRRRLLAQLAQRALEAGREVYMTANNKAEGCAPLSMLYFLEELSSLNT